MAMVVTTWGRSSGEVASQAVTINNEANKDTGKALSSFIPLFLACPYRATIMDQTTLSLKSILTPRQTFLASANFYSTVVVAPN